MVQINPLICTHIIYAFVGVDSNGVLSYLSPDAPRESTVLINVPVLMRPNFLEKITSLARLKKLNPTLMVLVAIGGANAEFADAFAALSESNKTRLAFVSNVVSFARQFDLDGIDIDYEFPTAADKNNLVFLLQDLRNAFQSLGYILSVAVGPDKWRAEIFYDIQEISRIVHFINLMTYDFRGSWDETVGQHAQMFPHENESAYRRELNCAASVAFWLSNGAAADKLVLGIPTYGNTLVLADAQRHKLGSPINITETKKSRQHMGYNEYCAMKSSGWKQHFDTQFRVYYAVHGFSWFGFDSIKQVTRKASYVKSLKLGGVMVWSLDNDDNYNDCRQGRFPLVTSIFQALNIF